LKKTFRRVHFSNNDFKKAKIEKKFKGVKEMGDEEGGEGKGKIGGRQQHFPAN
jgi:hypothetical protein